MRTPQFTNKFKKDMRRCEIRRLPINDLKSMLLRLGMDEQIEAKYKDHALIGNYAGCRNCICALIGCLFTD
jgi:mRNA interferase YafQ